MTQGLRYLLIDQDTGREMLKGKAKVHDTGFYIGADPLSPQLGDVRIEFKVVKPTEASVIAKQVGNTFVPYRTKAGGAIELLATGGHTADAMIQKEQDNVVNIH